MGSVKRSRKLLLLLAPLVLLQGARSAELRLVMTRSVPRGLYRETAPAWQRGALVEFCLCAEVGNLARRRGYVGDGPCPGGVGPVVKFIAGVAGDAVDVEPWHVAINGRRLEHSGRLEHDGEGRPVPHVPVGSLVLGPRELWLHSGYHPRGLDSRLCGPVGHWQVLGGLEAIWTE